MAAPSEPTADPPRDGPPGRLARRPRDFTWTDWKLILRRTLAETSRDNVTLIAAGVAFYAMLALFPALAALVTLYGFFADPATIQNNLEMASRFLPPSAFGIVRQQVDSIVASGSTTLGLASLMSIALALWSARLGVGALMTGLNVVYDEDDERGVVKTLAIALALTCLLLAVMLVAIGVVVAAPVVLDLLPLGPLGTWLAAVLRWPVMLVAVALAIGALYRWGPSRADARVGWVSWGAAIATLCWLVCSMLFSLYVANIASYNATYGSLGAVVALMMWLWLSAVIVLLGAELNAEMEHQTRRDTTTGRPRQMGRRGAHVADTLPPD